MSESNCLNACVAHQQLRFLSLCSSPQQLVLEAPGISQDPAAAAMHVLQQPQDAATLQAGLGHTDGAQDLTQQLSQEAEPSGSGSQSVQEAEQRRKARRAQAQRLRRAAQSAEQRAAVAAADAARHAAAR